jgi:[acyl-carrier-protein] S-malonyltransferase
MSNAAQLALFPGQGAITEGEGRLWSSSPHWPLVHQIGDITGVDVEKILLHLPDVEVIRTDNAQIGTFALSLVAFADFTERFGTPTHFLGHSLGEFSALVAAGVLSIEDGSRIVATRGAAMAAAADKHRGTMAALMGGEPGALEALGDLEDIWVANVNGDDQIVVSGTMEAIGRLEIHAKEIGWKRVRRLNVGGAFHSPLMASAADDLRAVLATSEFHQTDAKVYSNVDGAAHAGEEWRALCLEQLTSPVQFVAAVNAVDSSVKAAYEMPPGSTLIGLTKRIRTFETLDAYPWASR